MKRKMVAMNLDRASKAQTSDGALAKQLKTIIEKPLSDTSELALLKPELATLQLLLDYLETTGITEQSMLTIRQSLTQALTPPSTNPELIERLALYLSALNLTANGSVVEQAVALQTVIADRKRVDYVDLLEHQIQQHVPFIMEGIAPALVTPYILEIINNHDCLEDLFRQTQHVEISQAILQQLVASQRYSLAFKFIVQLTRESTIRSTQRFTFNTVDDLLPEITKDYPWWEQLKGKHAEKLEAFRAQLASISQATPNRMVRHRDVLAPQIADLADRFLRPEVKH